MAGRPVQRPCFVASTIELLARRRLDRFGRATVSSRYSAYTEALELDVFTWPFDATGKLVVDVGGIVASPHAIQVWVGPIDEILHQRRSSDTRIGIACSGDGPAARCVHILRRS